MRQGVAGPRGFRTVTPKAMSEGAWRISPGSDHQRFNAAGCWGQNRWWQLCDLNLVEEVAPDWHWRKRFLGVCERQIVNQSGVAVLATSFFNGFSFTVANEPDFDSRFWESGGIWSNCLCRFGITAPKRCLQIYEPTLSSFTGN